MKFILCRCIEENWNSVGPKDKKIRTLAEPHAAMTMRNRSQTGVELRTAVSDPDRPTGTCNCDSSDEEDDEDPGSPMVQQWRRGPLI